MLGHQREVAETGSHQETPLGWSILADVKNLSWADNTKQELSQPDRTHQAIGKPGPWGSLDPWESASSRKYSGGAEKGHKTRKQV